MAIQMVQESPTTWGIIDTSRGERIGSVMRQHADRFFISRKRVGSIEVSANEVAAWVYNWCSKPDAIDMIFLNGNRRPMKGIPPAAN